MSTRRYVVIRDSIIDWASSRIHELPYLRTADGSRARMTKDEFIERLPVIEGAFGLAGQHPNHSQQGYHFA